MLSLLVCSALLAAGAESPGPDVHRAYEEVRSQAGRSPDDQVRLALWCESHGMTAERLNHLALAVLADPAHATARGLMGLVADGGRWRRPEAVADRLKADPTLAARLAEYDARRQKAPYSADGQWALGVWCDEHGLKDQARAHLMAVTRLDPAREHAWRRLGYRRHGNRWATDAQVAAEHAEAEAQKQADRQWIPTLDRYKAMLDQPSRRAEAQAALAAVVDPRAVPSIARVFAAGRHPDQPRAVQLLGQVDGPAASRALAALAVFARSAEVRRSAVETLKKRDPRDFVHHWIALVRKPVRYEFTPVGGPGSPGTLTIEGPRANVRRVYAPPPLPTIPNLPGMTVAYDADGLPVLLEDLGQKVDRSRTYSAQEALQLAGTAPGAPDTVRLPAGAAASPILREIEKSVASATRKDRNLIDRAVNNPGNPQRGQTYAPIKDSQLQIPIGRMILEAQAEAIVAHRQEADDVAAIERANAATRKANEPTLTALRAVNGKDHGDDGTAWGRWWTDQLGYAFAGQTATAPTIVEVVPIAYTPQAAPLVVSSTVGFVGVTRHSCFAAGTSVRTVEGARRIESIRAGDLVLSQDTRTGSLGYRPVVTAFHNPPSPTLRVDLGGESIVATGIHRFWKAGKGWTMARDLRPGDPVRTLGGVAVVGSVVEDRVQPVFNLELADGRSFLVGDLGALVHDNSPVEATPAPFDAPTAPVALGDKPAR